MNECECQDGRTTVNLSLNSGEGVEKREKEGESKRAEGREK